MVYWGQTASIPIVVIGWDCRRHWGFSDNRKGYSRGRHGVLWAHKGENFHHWEGGEDSESLPEKVRF